jgi:hypothetical protein
MVLHGAATVRFATICGRRASNDAPEDQPVTGEEGGGARHFDRSLVFRREEGIVLRRVAGETILVPIRNRVADMRSVYSLNASAGEIWEWLDGQTPLGEIADRIVRDRDASREQVEADLAELVASLASAGLIHRVGG